MQLVMGAAGGGRHASDQGGVAEMECVAPRSPPPSVWQQSGVPWAAGRVHLHGDGQRLAMT